MMHRVWRALAAWIRTDPVRAVMGAVLATTAVWLVANPHPFDEALREALNRKVSMSGKLDVEAYLRYYGWWAALANSVLLGILLATRRWWRRWASLEPRAVALFPQAVPRWSWLILVGILLFATVYRGRIVERAIQFDEQDTLRLNVFGYEDVQPDGRLKFRKKAWSDAVFYNAKANNPVLYSGLAHVSLKVWRELRGAERRQFSLVAYRLPAFVAGILSLAAVWWALNVFGFVRAAPVATALLALHPMHADYTLQARGYSLVMLLVVVAATCGYLALRSGRWRWWWGFGLSLTTMMLAFAGSLYAALALGLVAGLSCVGMWRREGVYGRAQFVRLGLVGLLCAMGFLQIMAPILPQIREFLDQNISSIPLHLDWYLIAYQQYSGGVRFLPADFPGESYRSSWEFLAKRVLPENRMLAMLLLGLLPGLLVLGLVRVWRESRLVAAFLTAGVLAFLGALVHHGLFTRLYVFTWYLIYCLPFGFMLVALGATWVPRFLKGKAAWMQAIAPLLLIFLFAWETKPGRYGRPLMNKESGEPWVLFSRGRYDFYTFPQGRMLRQPRDSTPPDPAKLFESEPSD